MGLDAVIIANLSFSYFILRTSNEFLLLKRSFSIDFAFILISVNEIVLSFSFNVNLKTSILSISRSNVIVNIFLALITDMVTCLFCIYAWTWLAHMAFTEIHYGSSMVSRYDVLVVSLAVNILNGC